MIRKRFSRAYCLGAAKTRTTSIARAFSSEIKSEHEPDLARTLSLIKKIVNSDDSDIENELLKRDEELSLDLEASHPSVFFIPYFLKIFPDAKYIVTLRNPRSWLSSRLDFYYRKLFIEEHAPHEVFRYRLIKVKRTLLDSLGVSYVREEGWKEYNDLVAKKYYSLYSHEDRFLEELGIYPIETLVREYSGHYRLTERIPSCAKLTVNVNELDTSMEEIARFLGLSHVGLKQFSRENVNSGESRPRLLDRVDNKFVNNILDRHCSWMIDNNLVEKDWG